METTRNIIFIFVLILIIFFRIFVDVFIRYKKYGISGVKKYFKVGIITITCGIIIIYISISIYNFLPKYETEIDINIKNDNIITEINIDGNIYKMTDNIHIKKNRGFIAIKTENKNKIIFYENDKSIFSFDKKINIIINKKEIKINSYFINLTSFIDNIDSSESYNNILELLIKNM